MASGPCRTGTRYWRVCAPQLPVRQPVARPRRHPAFCLRPVALLPDPAAAGGRRPLTRHPGSRARRDLHIAPGLPIPWIVADAGVAPVPRLPHSRHPSHRWLRNRLGLGRRRRRWRDNRRSSGLGRGLHHHRARRPRRPASRQTGQRGKCRPTTRHLQRCSAHPRQYPSCQRSGRHQCR